MKALENRMDLFKITFVVCQLVSLIFLSLRIFFYNNALHATFVKGIKERLVEINQAQGIQLIETKAGKPEPVNLLAEPEEAEDEGGSMTREQIKICIKKLNRIAKEKGQSFEKTIDQIFNVKLEDTIPKLQSDNTPESIFKQMLKKINDKYGDHIKGANEAVTRTEVNAFIDKLANET